MLPASVLNDFGIEILSLSQALRLPPEAVVFDLLTALLDSWSVWNRAAGSAETGLRWRRAYLKLTYKCGAYRPYEDLVRDAAIATGLTASTAQALADDWDALAPWDEAPELLAALKKNGIRLAVVTNCSVELGRRAADRVDVAFDVVITSEEAGFYKPHPEPYRAALKALHADPRRALFVAGSPADIPGAAGVGMPVFWHNRAGLPFVADVSRPLLIADTLAPLGDLA